MIASALVDWYVAARRDLPWRRNPEPWRVLVAETMLQQTRVAVVAPRYEAFLSRFPDPAALAAADEDEVLALWSGLGYYRRARNLHAAARRIVEVHDGSVPGDREGLLGLPGVGEYTAGAVLSIAFGLPEPIVDGNVERVLSRVHLVRGSVKRGAAKKRIRALARETVEAAPPDLVNQAMMELGALVCLPRGPKCGECPLHDLCAAREAGVAEELPEKPAPRATEEVRLAVALVRRDGAVLLVRTPEGRLLAGTWAPPFTPLAAKGEAESALRRSAKRDHGLVLSVGAAIGTFRHTITHHRITARCHTAEIDGEPDGERARFVATEELGSYGLSSLARKSLSFHIR